MTEPGDNDYLWDRSGPADPDVARLEKLLAPLRHDAPLDEVRLQRRRRARWPWLVASAAVAAAAVVVIWTRLPAGPDQDPAAYVCRSEASGFTFSSQGGSVACGGTSVTGGVLPVGGVLDTGEHEAVLAIADIGDARLGSRTRVRLDKTSPQRHELYLERGRMHARVTAPPRLFAVGTPGANVTDLGCEYTLEVDERGAGSICVQSGKVELETGTARVVVVHAGTCAKLLPGRRASLPVIAGATPQIIAAVDDYDRGTADALEHLLAIATPADAITLAALVDQVPEARKRAVLERLMQVFPAPQELTVEEALADPVLWEMWHDEIVFQVDATAYEKSN